MKNETKLMFYSLDNEYLGDIQLMVQNLKYLETFTGIMKMLSPTIDMTSYHKNGKLHREDGPAAIAKTNNKETNCYYLFGKPISDKKIYDNRVYMIKSNKKDKLK